MRRHIIYTMFAVLVLCIFSGSAWATTKMAPTEAETGHPFTIIDTSGQRLVEGSVAVFRLGGLEVSRALRTQKPFNTAQGRLAPDMYAGLYAVSVRQPDGTEFEIGWFTVLGPTAPPPWIEPDLGAVVDFFTITDPLARMQTGDQAIFYAEGSDPALGAPATDLEVSNGGITLTGKVPAGATQGVQNFVSVRPMPTADARFGDLGFFVTVSAECVSDVDCDGGNACTHDFCDGGACAHPSFCEGTTASCGCATCVNCSAFDGWYNIGEPYQCCDGTSGCATCQDQEFRTYTCNGTQCTYGVTSTRTLILP